MSTLSNLFFTAIAALVFCTSAQANRESGGKSGATSVYINFGSFGTGIDRKSFELVEQLIAEAKARGEITGEVYQAWGREGEVLRCVEFTSFFLPSQFIKSVAPSILKDREETPRVRTSVRSGFDCDDYEQATEQDLTAHLR